MQETKVLSDVMKKITEYKKKKNLVKELSLKFTHLYWILGEFISKFIENFHLISAVPLDIS